MLFKTLLILMLSGTSSLYLLNFHGTRVDRKGLLSTFMCLEIFVKLFLDLVRCSTFTSLPRIDVCGWQNFWKLDTLPGTDSTPLVHHVRVVSGASHLLVSQSLSCSVLVSQPRQHHHLPAPHPGKLTLHCYDQL